MIRTFILKGIITLSLAVIFVSCKKDLRSSDETSTTGSIAKNGVLPFDFDWTTVDFMPTPPGQTQIPVPWIGQGSIASLYGIDVINDNKKEDGWVLVYSTFTNTAPGPLQNPYFMLYNRYRGLLRVFLYLTGSFAIQSSHLTNGLTLVSNTPSQMLAYMGSSFVDLTKSHPSFTQIEKAPIDGSMPMAPNKWFMMQYELAYDPQLGTIPFADMQLSWFTNYNTVSQISLGGNIEGTIKGTIVADGGSNNALNSALGNLGKLGGTVGLAALGSQFFNNASGSFPGNKFTYNADGEISSIIPGTSNNNIGLPDGLFTSLKNGMASGLSAAAGNIPGAIAGVFSAIFGGSSAPAVQTVSLNLDATITLNGTSTTSGSFPASPSSVWVPGTLGLTTANINNIQQYVPLHQDALGVFSISNAPIVHKVNGSNLNTGGPGKPNTTYINYSAFTIDHNSYTVQFNPAVTNNPDPLKNATISNLMKELVIRTNGTGAGGNQETVGNANFWTTTENSLSSYLIAPTSNFPRPISHAFLRISFDITPNNNPGAKAHIIKTFVCQEQ